MRHRIIGGVATGVLIALILAGCGDDDPSSDVAPTTSTTSVAVTDHRPVLTSADDGRTITIEKGDQLTVKLEVNGGSGYSWDLLEGTDPTVLDVVSTTQATTTPTTPDEPVMTGRPETMTTVLRSIGTGDERVRFGLIAPAGGQPEDTFEVRIVVV